MKSASETMQIAKHAAIADSVPRCATASTPSVKKLSASPIQIAPARSYWRNVPVVGNFGIVLKEAIKSSVPIGTLIMNSHDQCATARIAPPSVGPAAALV